MQSQQGMFVSELAKRIREEREKQGLSQSELAQKSSTTQPNISAIERALLDNPSFELIQRILYAMDMKICLYIRRYYRMNKEMYRKCLLKKGSFSPQPSKDLDGEINILRQYIGNQINMHRKFHNMTQKELAVKANTTQKKISDMERGKLNFRVKYLLKVLSALDIGIHAIDIKKLSQSYVPRQVWSHKPDDYWRMNYKNKRTYEGSYHDETGISMRDSGVTNAERKEFNEERYHVNCSDYDDWGDWDDD